VQMSSGFLCSWTRPNLIGFSSVAVLPLVNSVTKLFYDVMSFLPRPPLKRPIQFYAYN